MEAAMWVGGIAGLAFVFVLNQHGWGNVLLALGRKLFDAGTRFNQRTDARREVVMRQWRGRIVSEPVRLMPRCRESRLSNDDGTATED